jgi:hypothetical protein
MKSKLQIAQYLLGRCATIFLHVDTRAGVGICAGLPASKLGRPQVILQVGPDMPIPIPDLCIDAHGFRGTLSFNGHPHLCVVSWDAVKAIVGDDGKGAIFDEAWAREVTAGVGTIAPAVPAHPSERSYLRRVK